MISFTTHQPDLETVMFHFFERTPDLVCIAGKEGYFQKVNSAVISKLGYSREEIFSRPISSFVHPDDKEKTAATRKELIDGKPLLNFENRYICKNGDIIWLHWTSIYIPEREIVFALAKDVTKKKIELHDTEEKYKKFKSLASHFKSALEKDKKRLAIELHEELAQVASVIKMDIELVQNRNPEIDKESLERLEHAHSAAEMLIDSIRRISYAISPNMIEDLGLNETLTWLSEEFTSIHGITCVYESNGTENLLPQDIKIDIFRICQESLKFIVNHSHASRVHIKFDNAGDKICLIVTDDGNGHEANHVDHTLEMTSLRERAATIHADLQITTVPGEGTRICIYLPSTPD